MKELFSIVINHEYDRIDAAPIEPSGHLSIVPANSNSILVNTNRLLFRTRTGFIGCYIEDDEAVRSEVDFLFFWVVCRNPEFFSYTDYPNEINFSKPYYYWSNHEGGTVLKERDFWDLNPGTPPKMAIGCIAISMTALMADRSFTIEFNTRRTLWTYYIIPKETQLLWDYSIVDEIFLEQEQVSTNGSTVKKWVFKKILVDGALNTDQEKHKLIFQSIEPIPYFKRASNRFKLKWGPKVESQFEKNQEMILPFANYSYKMVNEDNIELTPVYIYI